MEALIMLSLLSTFIALLFTLSVLVLLLLFFVEVEEVSFTFVCNALDSAKLCVKWSEDNDAAATATVTAVVVVDEVYVGLLLLSCCKRLLELLWFVLFAPGYIDGWVVLRLLIDVKRLSLITIVQIFYSNANNLYIFF